MPFVVVHGAVTDPAAARLANQAHDHVTNGDHVDSLLPVALDITDGSRVVIDLAIAECAYQRVETRDPSWDRAAALLSELLRVRLFG